MSWRNERPCLESKPWRVLQLRGTDYLFKGHFQDTGYHVMLSDLSSIWEEKLDSDDILKRSKMLNSHIEAPLPVLLKTLSTHVVSSELDSSYSLPTPTSTHPHSLTLTLTTTLASLPFQWEFNLEKGPPDSMGLHLVGPLLSMVSELSHRGEEMARLLAHKDKEIQDYKEQGAEVTRKYLETPLFADKAFSSQMTSSSGFVSRVYHPLCVLGRRQELYEDVATARIWAQINDGVIDEPSDGLPSSSLATSPIKSPAKKPPPESPSKEDETVRRKELEKKLEMEKQRPKKKKRKLM